MDKKLERTISEIQRCSNLNHSEISLLLGKVERVGSRKTLQTLELFYEEYINDGHPEEDKNSIREFYSKFRERCKI